MNPAEQLLKKQAHLLGEAFPEHFTITFTFKREEGGPLAKTCDCVASPRCKEEWDVLKFFLNKINPK